mgnify:FL=1|tara:strand:- start:24937 stop:25296 length:360 start_codon:yes stop_codon:yes gene_type:complete
MGPSKIITQLRFTDLEAALDFYTRQLGFELAFCYEDFYAGVSIGEQMLHLKRVDEPDPNINWVRENTHLHVTLMTQDLEAWRKTLVSKGLGVSAIKNQPWGRECVITDPGGHTLYCMES